MPSSSSLSALVPMLVAVVAGAAVPFQAAGNAALGRALGHPLWATLASLLVSMLVVLPVLAILRAPAPTLGPALHGPAWVWLGGVAGVAYITAALMLTPRMGASAFIVSVIAGQMLASLLIDSTGLMGLQARPVGGLRIAGVVLILLGMVAVQLDRPAPGSTDGGATHVRR